MVKTVKFGSLDALVGLSFDSGSLAYSAPTKINGTVTNTTASSTEVLTYYGLSATVGSPFITLPNISFKVVSVSDATNELTIDAYYGSSMVAELGFTVTGFSAAGLALSSIPIDAMVLTEPISPRSWARPSCSATTLRRQRRNRSSSRKAISIPSPSAKVVFGTAKADTITGTTGPQTLLGMDGNDRIVAGSGADMLYGGNGADVLIAGAGNDTLYGAQATTCSMAAPAPAC
jgi:Ca2+-binding RTX toxin-like protein